MDQQRRFFLELLRLCNKVYPSDKGESELLLKVYIVEHKEPQWHGFKKDSTWHIYMKGNLAVHFRQSDPNHFQHQHKRQPHSIDTHIGKRYGIGFHKCPLPRIL